MFTYHGRGYPGVDLYLVGQICCSHLRPAWASFRTWKHPLSPTDGANNRLNRITGGITRWSLQLDNSCNSILNGSHRWSSHWNRKPFTTASMGPQWDRWEALCKFPYRPFPSKGAFSNTMKAKTASKEGWLTCSDGRCTNHGSPKVLDFGQSWRPEETLALEFSVKIKNFVNDKQWAFCVPNRLKERGANRIRKFIRQIRPKRRGKSWSQRCHFLQHQSRTIVRNVLAGKRKLDQCVQCRTGRTAILINKY